MEKYKFFEFLPIIVKLKLINKFFNLTKKNKRLSKKQYKYYTFFIKQYRYLNIFSSSIKFIKIK